MTVNIYVYTTAKPPRKHKTGYAYVLETTPHDKPVTLTAQGVLEDYTKNEAELAAVIKALEHLRKPSELRIYTTPFMASTINGWLKKWEASGWKTMSGNDISENYKRLAELLKPHTYTAVTEISTYSQWLQRTAEEEERK